MLQKIKIFIDNSEWGAWKKSWLVDDEHDRFWIMGTDGSVRDLDKPKYRYELLAAQPQKGE